jgi:hypothetical protein
MKQLMEWLLRHQEKNVTTTLFSTLIIILYIAIAVLLIVGYRNTRNRGLLWLIFALIASRVLPPAFAALLRHTFNSPPKSSSNSLVGFLQRLVLSGRMSRGELLIESTLIETALITVLFLVAVYYLGRKAVTSAASPDSTAL